MQRLYQWLSERASFFCHDAVDFSRNSNVRMETTVRLERVTLLAGGAAPFGLDFCPLCGSKLAPGQSERASHRPANGAIPLEADPPDSQPPRITNAE